MMSGKENKAAGKQATKGGSGTGDASPVAPVNAPDDSGSELPVALSGHYVAVVAPSDGVNQPVSAAPDAQPSGTGDAVEVLLVKSVKPNGFYRAGRFWPHSGVHVFVSDDPDGDNAESVTDDGIPVQPFISRADAARLKAEPQLRVTVVESVTAESQGE
ncbi:hypothetical protein [Gibbsiella quercinecans]|uniref:hypothetical protein n=1 Tax=Gibbsiella quercinecans TaxID=929813 RepID=UPI0011C40284|nr:hypothetical protein [Gibbsiella quercinecans]